MTNTIVISLVLVVLVIILMLIFNKNKHQTKSSVVKKDEVIAKYKKQLEDILEKYKDDNDTKIKQKKLFLKKCNSELSRNIFFTQSQAHKVIKNLASL